MFRLNLYLIKEILKKVFIIFSVAGLIFLAYSSVHFLEDAANEELPTQALLPLISLKVLIACEVLFPLSLFLSGVLTFSRMQADRELAALQATGIGPRQIFVPLIFLALFFGIITACLSIFIRPWAYGERSRIQSEVKKKFWFQSLRPGRFHERDQGRLVFFIEEKKSPNKGRTVFVQNRMEKGRQILFADKIIHHVKENKENSQFSMFNGSMSLLTEELRSKIKVDFKEYDLKLDLLGKEREKEYRTRSKSMAGLIKQGELKDIAELQWRISNPLNALLLGLLCFPLGVLGTWGRQGKVVLAMLFYASFYILQSVTETWIEQGILPQFPGNFSAGLYLFLGLALLTHLLKNYLVNRNS